MEHTHPAARVNKCLSRAGYANADAALSHLREGYQFIRHIREMEHTSGMSERHESVHDTHETAITARYPPEY